MLVGDKTQVTLFAIQFLIPFFYVKHLELLQVFARSRRADTPDDLSEGETSGSKCRWGQPNALLALFPNAEALQLWGEKWCRDSAGVLGRCSNFMKSGGLVVYNQQHASSSS